MVAKKSKNKVPSKKQRKKPETTWGKIWHFIWHDDSTLSWIANIVLAFIIIKFIIYPLLALSFGTSLPIVAVISSSMEHDGSFDNWWASQAICDYSQVCSQEEWYAQRNISKEDFKTYPFKNGFNKGDLILLFGVRQDKLDVGDVLVYDAMAKTIPIIHRVVSIDIHTTDGVIEYIYETKGDNNPYPIIKPGLNESNIMYSSIRGKAVGRIPYLGYVKIWFVEFMQSLSGKTANYSTVDVALS
jgi:signal peptidase I